MAEQRRALLSLHFDGIPKRLRGSCEEVFQLRAALIERQRSEILPVELEEVERDQTRHGAPPLGAQRMKVRPTVLAQTDRLAVDRQIAAGEALDRGDDPREEGRPVVGGARPQRTTSCEPHVLGTMRGNCRMTAEDRSSRV
jgi:hypothetical protein